MSRQTGVALMVLVAIASVALAVDELPGLWSNWRGPDQNGTSDATGMPESWSPSGENLVWKVPIAGRSAPILMGDRLYMLNASEEGAARQEQVLCLNANTGRTLWHYRFNFYGSDVPPHRIAWASPVGDPSTGRIYIMGGSGRFLCLDRDGKLVWEKSLAEEFGLITTHGGRTVTPVVHGDLVITSGIMPSWGAHARSGHRYLAMNKNTGDVVWFAQPGANPYDTCYPTPVIAEFGGKQMLVDGGADGAIYAMKLLTGEKIWHYPFSKRAINASVVTDGKAVYASHGQENYDTNVMGRVVALNPTGTGELGRDAEIWRADGLVVEFPSAALHNGRLYMSDNGANLICLDSSNGKELWRQTLGTIQKASPVYADGKLYIGTENGKFYILKPSDTECKVLDVDELSPVAGEEEILASVAVAPGRIYLVSTKNTYCIGAKNSRQLPPFKPVPVALARASSSGPVAYVQVTPTELLLRPGQQVQFKAASFDPAGRLIRQENATWSLAGLKGSIGPDGKFTAGEGFQAGEVRAAVGEVAGAARARVMPPIPWNEDFESYAPKGIPPHWVGAGGKFEIREVEGNKVLVKLANEFSLLRRARAYMGPWTLSGYTMEADVFGTERRRQIPDIGIIAQTYALVLSGNTQKLTIESWTPETERSVTVPFPWKSGAWYRMKLSVETRDGKGIVRGKVWPKSDPEPQEWSITKEDPQPSLKGAPGFYCYAHNEAYYDNIKVTENSK